MPPVDSALVASELRVVLGQLVRRLRAENRLPLSHGGVLGRLDRHGPSTASELATSERVRPQSMAHTLAELEKEGLIVRRPDPGDGRRALVALTDRGRATLQCDRRLRDGWLSDAITHRLSPSEQAALVEAVAVLRRLAES